MKIGADEVRRLDWFGVKSGLARLLGSRLVNPVVQLGARALPARIARRLPLNRPRVTYRLQSGGEIQLLDTSKDILARDLFWGKGQPTSTAEQHKLRCIELLSKRAATFLDVGAYGGVCALIAARANPALRAIAYEIVPENYLLIVRNIIENDLATRVEARLKGVGERPGSLRLPRAIGLSSYPMSMSLGSSFDAGVEVSVATLDSETQGMDGPFLLKIDVEGYEEQVFEGARTFIAAHRPDIICEVLPDAAQACRAIEEMLAPLGYRWLEFDDSGLTVRDQLKPRDSQRDWLLTAQASTLDAVETAAI